MRAAIPTPTATPRIRIAARRRGWRSRALSRRNARRRTPPCARARADRRSATEWDMVVRVSHGRSGRRYVRGPMRTGHLIVIGGAEDKIRDRVILSRLVALAGGSRARIAVIATASSFALEVGERYRQASPRRGVGPLDPHDRLPRLGPDAQAANGPRGGARPGGATRVTFARADRVVCSPSGRARCRNNRPSGRAAAATTGPAARRGAATTGRTAVAVRQPAS